MIDKIQEKWADEGAAFSDDAGLIVQAITDMSESMKAAVSALEAAIDKVEIPGPDPTVAESINALARTMNKPPVVNLAAPDLSGLKAAVTEIGNRQGKVLSTIEALLRILNEPKKPEPLKEFAVEVDRNSTTSRIQSMVIRQIK
jgi:hypothetical protein